MRVTKYKAWDTYRKKMWSAEELGRDELTINPDGRGFVNVHSVSTKLSHYLPHLIPLQFINHKDKKEVEIYETDIIKARFKGEPSKSFEGEVYWDDEDVSFSFGSLNEGIKIWELIDIEVIGNSYVKKAKEKVK